MTFVFPSINGTLKPRERSGHIAAHFDGYLVIWGGYFNVRKLTCFKSFKIMGGGWEVVQIFLWCARGWRVDKVPKVP